MSIYLYDSYEKVKSVVQYTIYNIEIKDSAVEDVYHLILMLWQHRCSYGVLTRDMITQMVKCKMLIKNADINSISNASYDLLLGDEYYYAGKVKKLSNTEPFISIEPYDYIVASSKELVSIPRDVSGRFDLVVNLFFQGIILSNSTQVDPGFNGRLFCLLFNTSNKTVNLKRGKPFATIEFSKLCEPTTPYSGDYADEESISVYLPNNIMNGAINELKREVEELKKESKNMQNMYLSALSILIAVISIFFATSGK